MRHPQTGATQMLLVKTPPRAGMGNIFIISSQDKVEARENDCHLIGQYSGIKFV
jgi:hypothetical protein